LEKNSPGGPLGAYKLFKGNSFSGKFYCENSVKLFQDDRAVHYGFSKKKISKIGYTGSEI